jgi:2-polyprenyl-6-hydroxyphenyl methylase / 3-demethylubiquinone-9 3-methyltransferase
MAARWWDAEGPFRPLHQLNPIRLQYIRDQLCRQFDRDPSRPRPLDGLRIADIGCGGGLLCEPMSRLGAKVVGVDPSEENIEAAKAHATAGGLNIDYVAATAEDLSAWGEEFDVVLNMEVVEHVADVPGFLQACASLFRSDDSSMVIATLNRTAKAYILAIVGAEYVLGWLPKGTHDWNRFIRPSEFRRFLATADLEIQDLCGISYEPISRAWRLSPSLAVNYMGFVTKP